MILRQNAKGEKVEALQKLLNLRLLLPTPLGVDGHFGAKTAQAVRRFQAEQGLGGDGVVGPQTLAALERPEVLKWMALARKEVGQREIAGSKHNPRIVEYLNTTTNIAQSYRDKDETAWCAAFVNWVMRHAGYPGTNHALAKSWSKWGYGCPPMYGSITVIKKIAARSDASTGSTTGYHVGFMVSKSLTHLRLLGGNQRDQVKYSNYPLSRYRIDSHRWPTPVGVPLTHSPVDFAYA